MFSKKFYFGTRLQGHITTHTSDNTLKKKIVFPFVLHFLAVFERKKEKNKVLLITGSVPNIISFTSKIA